MEVSTAFAGSKACLRIKDRDAKLLQQMEIILNEGRDGKAIRPDTSLSDVLAEVITYVAELRTRFKELETQLATKDTTEQALTEDVDKLRKIHDENGSAYAKLQTAHDVAASKASTLPACI